MRLHRKLANNVQIPELRIFLSEICLLFLLLYTAVVITEKKMRFTIKTKLFLTLLLTILTVVVAMVFLIKLSFERGFLEYVNRLEQESHENLVINLVDAYQQNGSWNFIRENPRLWKEMHRQSIPTREMLEHDDAGPTPRYRSAGPRTQPHDRPRPPHSRRFGGRRKGGVCLLDEAQEAVTYCRQREADWQIREIVIDENTVGYLATAPRRKLSDEHDLRFSEKQHRFLLLLALCITLVSIIVAFPLSRQLVKPIKELTRATRKLAAGEYQTRTSISSSDELADLSRDFNSLALTLENNEQARKQWIADISHELRTPLSVLRGEIEALQDGVREMSQDRLESLHMQIMNLNRLINDLYELSMSDIGALNYEKELVNIVEVLSGTINSMSAEFESKGVAVSFTHEQDDIQLFADGERMQQLFSNLLTNSLRYTDAPGQLEIDVGKKGETIVIVMQDSAPGVESEDLPKLFERLYRVDSSRNRETGGTGLGLAICSNIVEAHSGKLSAETSLLGGLKIVIELAED
ncbi:MAG: HAMP domain-containing protein [Gammaproteobacteria bacterium]|nr:HAMP domain-containing protein [Gammaproteobacteria bacterium]